MSTEGDLRLYLREHLTFELLILRFTFGGLENSKDQLEWNAYFEALQSMREPYLTF
jgi:hypothetical protein